MLSKIEIEVLNSLTIAELSVLRYLDNNKEDVLDLTIQELADRNFVSTTTVMRLCKKLGFTGFTELKYKIKDMVSIEDCFNKNLTFEKIKSDHLTNIASTANLLDKQMLEEIVDKMLEAEHIHFFGKGLSGSVFTYFSKILHTLGVNNTNYHDTHIAYINGEKMTNKDLIFISSLSGKTSQTIRMAQICKSRDAKIVSLTSNTQNPLSQLSDYPITFMAGTRNPKVADILSRTPILFIFDIIIEMYIAKKMGA